MNNNFKSIIGQSFSSYLSFRRSLNYKLIYAESLLIDLDSYINSNYQDEKILTKEIVYGWGFPKDSKNLPQTINKRLALLTSLGKFLTLFSQIYVT